MAIPKCEYDLPANFWYLRKLLSLKEHLEVLLQSDISQGEPLTLTVKVTFPNKSIRSQN